MVDLKKIINRQYDGRTCIKFDYLIVDMENPNVKEPLSVLIFKRNAIDPKMWLVTFFEKRNKYKDTENYYLMFETPEENYPLDKIVKCGLREVYYILVDEINKKTILKDNIFEMMFD